MERPPKRSASERGFGFDGPEVIRARLNQTLTRPSEWVHLGEIIVIHVGLPTLKGGPTTRPQWMGRRHAEAKLRVCLECYGHIESAMVDPQSHQEGAFA